MQNVSMSRPNTGQLWGERRKRRCRRLLLAQDRENQAAALGAEMERTRAELLLLAGFAPEEAVDIGTLPIPDASRWMPCSRRQTSERPWGIITSCGAETCFLFRDK